MVSRCDSQVARLDEVVGKAPRQAATVLVRGRAGCGKTALLGTLVSALRKRERRVLSVSADGMENADFTELFFEAAQEYFEHNSMPELLICLANLGAATAQFRAGMFSYPVPLAHEIGNLLTAMMAGADGVVVIDDLHRMDGRTVTPMYLAVDRLRLAGLTVVFGDCDPAVGGGGYDRSDNTWYQSTIQHSIVFNVPELTAGEQADAIAKVLRAKPDDATVAAVRAALGCYAGNYATLVATVKLAVDDGEISCSGGYAFLSDAVSPSQLRLPHDHHLLGALRASAPEVGELASALAVLGGIRNVDLDLLTQVFEQSPAQSRRALDSLTADGILRVDDNGTVSFDVPALALSLLHDCDPDDAARLHAEQARHLLALVDAGETGRGMELADHIVAAGKMFDLADPAEILIREAERCFETMPERAARWYRAALDLRTPVDACWTDVLGRLIDTYRRLGRWGELVDVASEAFSALRSAGAISADLLTDVVLHWILALLYLDRPSAVRDVIDELSVLSPRNTTAMWLQDHLRNIVCGRVGEVSLCAMAISHPLGPVLPLALQAVFSRGVTEAGVVKRWNATTEAMELWSALSWGDVASLCDRIVPGACGAGDGLMPRYGRMRQAFADGAWDAVLRLGNEIDLRAGEDPESYVRQAAAAMTAFVHVQRGDLRRALRTAISVQSCTTMAAGAHLVAAAHCATTWATGSAEDAYRDGRSIYLQLSEHGARPGIEMLLDTLIELAVTLGHADDAMAMTEDLRSLLSATESPAVRLVLQRAHAVLHHDANAAMRSVKLAKWLGQPFQIAKACLLAGELAEEPEEWLREAQGIFRELGSQRGRSAVAEIMRSRGMAIPRRKRTNATLSATELRLAQLVSAGKTNRQIAVALGVSEKTIEGYLTRVFNKTGCKTRVDLTVACLAGELAA